MTTSKWQVDPAHSVVDFSVRHLMISKVKGCFNEFSAVIDADLTDLTSARISLEIQTASVDTRNADRDAHLRGGDFFDAENHPTLCFTATEICAIENDQYSVTGDCTICGITCQETFTCCYVGCSTDPWGNEKVAFTVEGCVNRSDYGLTYNAVLETGGVLISDLVNISAEIQACKCDE